jgi:hypothetical protein
MASDGMIYVPGFMKIGLGIQVMLMTITIQEAGMFILLMGRIYDVCD